MRRRTFSDAQLAMSQSRQTGSLPAGHGGDDTSGDFRLHYSGRHVLVTGGLGFLGLNLVTHLCRAGALVRVLQHASADSRADQLPLLKEVERVTGDIRDSEAVRRALVACDTVFNLAGRSGAIASNASPFDDLDVNLRGQLTLLETCRQHAPGIKVVFPSSRLVYRPHTPIPVPESAPTYPISMYGIHKLAGENYHLLYDRLHHIHAVILRVTNPYGPLQRRDQDRYGIVNWFIHRAVRGLDLPVYGNGEQLRDYVHVNDVMAAFLMAGANPAANGMIFNVGSGQGVSFMDMGKHVVEVAGGAVVRKIEWPAEAAAVETGDFVADIALIEKVLGWRPRVELVEGINDVVLSYQSFMS